MSRPAVWTRARDLASLFEVTCRPDADGFARGRNDETNPPGQRGRTRKRQRGDGSQETQGDPPSRQRLGKAHCVFRKFMSALRRGRLRLRANGLVRLIRSGGTHAATRRWTALITSATLMSSMQRSVFLHFRSYTHEHCCTREIETSERPQGPFRSGLVGPYSATIGVLTAPAI